MNDTLVIAPPHAHPDRDVRQREIVPPAALANCHALVIGVGAIGRQVALQLAAVGMPALDLIDDDAVGVENLASQAYCPADLGRPKVEATADVCRSINPDVAISTCRERFRRSSARSLACFASPSAQSSSTQSPSARPVVFCCVDSIATRQLIWEAVRGRAAFWSDGRMSAEVVRVLASDRPAADPYYPTTLFAPERAHAGACTAKSTVYTASIAAGLMLGQLTRWLRGMAVDRDLTLNLLSAELTAG